MIVLEHVRLIDGTGSECQEDVSVMVGDGKIKKIGRGLEVPAGCIVVDGTGKTVIPGLIDAHTHFSGSSLFTRPGMDNANASRDFAEGREGCLRWGVTTVRTCGDMEEDILGYVKARRDGTALRGPNVVACGPMFQANNGHPYFTIMPGNTEALEKAIVLADIVDDLEGEIDRILDNGASFVKCVYGHVNRTDRGNSVPRLGEDILARIVAHTHKRGKKVCCHVDTVEEMVAAAEMGIDSIEHCTNVGSTNPPLTEEMIEAVKKSGAVLDPTNVALGPWEALLHIENGTCAYNLDLTKRMYDAGVPLAIGCDSGIPLIPFGEAVHEEMALFVKAGIDPLAVLKIATHDNAVLLGVDDRAGTIEEGKNADLVLVDGNPLADIADTKNIRLVIQDGDIVSGSVLPGSGRVFG